MSLQRLGWIFTACLTGGLTTTVIAEADPFARLSQTDLDLGHYRAANGRPAASYWQQQVDYDIRVDLDPRRNAIRATARVRYHNHSPDTLHYLYFALDHDALQPDSAASLRLQATPGNTRDKIAARANARGFQLHSVTAQGKPIVTQQRNTLLQVELPTPLATGKSQQLELQWSLPLTNKVATGARSGFEQLSDNSPIFVAAQWFPRATAYTDYAGWQLKPFLQQGEFSTEFGNYQVTITAPANFTVAASGQLRNAEKVLDREQLEAWRSESTQSRWIVDAQQAQAQRAQGVSNSTRTWEFSGKQLRDFAFSASPAFQWQMRKDALGRRLHQFFPAEGALLWQPFGLDAIAHTLQVFDSALLPLPYTDISIVNAAGIGMEYPGLATIATRPERAQSTETLPAWDALTKYDFIGSVIHEVGHNYLPMVINTDEREWAWLDEGLISFIEYRAEHSWEANFDVIYGEPRSIAKYTAGTQHQPIMTSADSLHRKIDNAYNKTASVLNTLRHLVLGPETFDPALRAFAESWQGKRPTPGDFFRAIETTAGTDLSWFWRSWFYTNATIDLSIINLSLNDHPLELVPVDTQQIRENNYSAPPALAYTAGGIRTFRVDAQPELADAYTRPLPSVRAASIPLETNRESATNWYTLSIANQGNGILPVPIELYFQNGQRRALTLPAQTWMRADANILTISFPVSIESTVTGICLDPLWLSPDIQRNNNCVNITSTKSVSNS